MNEIIKSQIRFLEIKLSTAKDPEQIKLLEGKLAKLKENIDRTIVAVPSTRHAQDVPLVGMGPGKKRRKKKNLIPTPEPILKEEVKEAIPEIDLELETKEVEAEVVKLEEENALKEIVEDSNTPEGVSIFEEPIIGGDKPSNEAEVEDIVAEIEKAIEEEVEKDEPLPTVEEIEAEIEKEEVEILEDSGLGDVLPDTIIEGETIPLEEKEDTPLVPQPGEVEFEEEKESETKQVESDESSPIEVVVESSPIEVVVESGHPLEVPTVAPSPVIETNTTTIKKKVGRPKGSSNKKSTPKKVTNKKTPSGRRKTTKK